MNDIRPRHTKIDLDYRKMPGKFGADGGGEEEDDDSSDIFSKPSVTELAATSPRLIVSPKMQNIHMIVQREGNNSDEINTEYKDCHVSSDLRIEPRPSRNGRSAGEGHTVRAKRQSVLWAQNQAEEDELTRERARAEAERLVGLQGARARAEVRAKAEELAKTRPLPRVKGEDKLKAQQEAGLKQKEMDRRKAERETRLKAEKERLLIEEDARRRKAKEEKEFQDKQVVDLWDEEAQKIAVDIIQGIYDEVSYKEYANFLGAKENRRVLQKFIAQLEPLPNSLLLALYKLVIKVYFIAEAQAIDRILEELSIGWTTANPTTHWGFHYKLCHIVLFSLLILNSDLHNAENSQPKFSKEEFIENTLYAVGKEADKTGFNLKGYELDIREELGVYYDALKHMSLPLLNRDDNKKTFRDPKNSREGKMRLGRRSSKFSISSQTNNSADNSSSDDETSVSSDSSASAKRESHYTSNWRFHNNKPLPRLYHKEPFDESFAFSNGTSWCMDSGIKINERNMVLSSGDRSAVQKATHPRIPSSAGGLLQWITRSKSKSKSKSKSLLHGNRPPIAFFDDSTKWVNVRCRVCEGRIYVFRDYPPSTGPQNTLEGLEVLKKASDYYFVCSLYEAVATLVQDNVVVNNSQTASCNDDLNQRGNFTVTIPEALHRGKTILEFQTSSVQEAQKFVQSVNFWAARLTPVPSAQFEIVSNEENGWSPQVLSKDQYPEALEQVCLNEWRPLLSIGHLYSEQENYTENTDMLGKMKVLDDFAEYLQQNIDSHNRVKPSMISVWQRTRNFDKAMDNWNKKYLYLNELNERTSIHLAALKLIQENTS